MSDESRSSGWASVINLIPELYFDLICRFSTGMVLIFAILLLYTYQASVTVADSLSELLGEEWNSSTIVFFLFMALSYVIGFASEVLAAFVWLRVVTWRLRKWGMAEYGKDNIVARFESSSEGVKFEGVFEKKGKLLKFVRHATDFFMEKYPQRYSVLAKLTAEARLFQALFGAYLVSAVCLIVLRFSSLKWQQDWWYIVLAVPLIPLHFVWSFRKKSALRRLMSYLDDVLPPDGA